MEDRKKDHIHLAFSSRTAAQEADCRFYYEPMLAPHHSGTLEPFHFAGKHMTLPVWVSSMTGGTQQAGTINRNLARACGEFGMGMGLGSCRVLLKDETHLDDFNVRQYMGDQSPLYANLGIAQLEKLVTQRQENRLEELVHRLQADGLIIHVNPLQEAFQPEGDLLKIPPIETIQALLENSNLRIIVKEVGQGMGPESLRQLLALPLEAIEYGAFGGTNFTKVEQSRHKDPLKGPLESFENVGHTALEMTQMINNLVDQTEVKCNHLIISGGITQVTDGYYLTQISRLPSVFGMGSQFLKHAMVDYQTLKDFVLELIKGWKIASQYLTIREQ